MRRYSYRDGYVYGQRDVLTWLRGDACNFADPDVPLAAFDRSFDRDASLWCLAHNLATAGGLCASFYLGKHFTWHAMLDMPEPAEWSPGCGRSAS